MTDITVSFGGRPIEVQLGENTQAALDASARAVAAAAAATALFTSTDRAGTIAQRGAIPIGQRTYEMEFHVNDIVPPRTFVWRKDAAGVGADDWLGLPTPSEQSNLGNATGVLKQENAPWVVGGLAGLDSALGSVNTNSIERDGNLQNQVDAIKGDTVAITSLTATPPAVAVGATVASVVLKRTVTGSVTKQYIEWDGGKYRAYYDPAATDLTVPPAVAAPTSVLVIGSSLSIPGKWVEAAAAAAGLAIKNAALYASTSRKQALRVGAFSTYLTLASGTLPAAGTEGTVTLINGAAPTYSNADAILHANEGDADPAGHQISGTLGGRHVTIIHRPATAPNVYKIFQDAGGTALAIPDGSEFVPDWKADLATSEIWGDWGQNGYDVPEREFSNLDAILRLTRSPRIYLSGVLNDATQGTGTAGLAAVKAYNAQFKARYPQYYLEMRAALLAAGSSTGNDAADRANEIIPRSQRTTGGVVDSLHPGTAGNTTWANTQIVARTALGVPPALTSATVLSLTVSDVTSGNADTARVSLAGMTAADQAKIALQVGLLANVGGTANAITADAPAGMTAYTSGQILQLVASSTNTAASPTLNVGGLGPMTLTDEIGGAVQPGDIEGGKLYELRVSTSSSTIRIIASHSSKRRVLADANLTGTPTAVTQAYTDGSNKIATTAMVQAAKKIGIYTLPNVGGLANAITADAPSGSNLTAYASGQTFIFFAASSNTMSSPTIDISGLGAIPLLDGNGATLNAGDIVGGYPYTIRISAASPWAARVVSAGYPVAVAKVDAKRALSYSPNLYIDPEFTLLAAGQTQSWTNGLMTAEKRKGALALRTPASGSSTALQAPFTVAVEDLPSGLLSVSVVIREKESTLADANFRFRIEAENSAGSPIVANGTWPTTGNGDGAGQRWEKNVPFAAIAGPTPFVIADSVPIALPVAAGAVRFRLLIREQTTGKVWISHINMRDGIDSTYEPPRAAAASTPSTVAVLKSTTSLPNGAQGQNTAGGGFTCTGLDRIGPTGKFAGCWIVGNDGRIGPDTITTGPETVNNCSIVILSPDFTRIVREFNIKGNTTDFPSAGSIQGVAWDSSDDTIWFTEQNSKQIYHIDMTGAKIADTINPSTFFNTPANLPNGIAYDSVNDALWVGEYTTARAYRIACAAGHAVQVTLATALAADHDQMGYDETTGYLYYSKGANGFNAEVYVVASATGAAVRSWTGLELSQAVEGVFIDFTKKRLFLVNDGGFHAAAQPPLALANMYEFGA